MAAEVSLLVEYFGGPRDGVQSDLLRSIPGMPYAYPPEIRAVEYDLRARTETYVGRYVREGRLRDGLAMRYVWVQMGRQDGQTKNAS